MIVPMYDHLYPKVTTYNPASGVPPVEGRDYRILSQGQVRCQAARYGVLAGVFAVVTAGTGIAGLLTPICKAVGLPSLPYEPDLVQSATLLSMTAYALKKLRENQNLSRLWAKEQYEMKTRGYTHLVWFNPVLRQGDQPDGDPHELNQRALETIDRGYIPISDRTKWCVLISGGLGEVRKDGKVELCPPLRL